MKLAAMQRPHAPPVPPRPSRQVVAEALKRTARLPCPTRQAPPPPNTQPWRPNDKPNVPAKGRTVVYESVKDVKQLIYGCGNRNDEFTKPVVVKTQQECLDKSERTTVILNENRRESLKQQQQQQQQKQLVCQLNSETDRENIAPLCERVVPTTTTTTATSAHPIANVEDTITSLAASRKDVVTNECALSAVKIHDLKDTRGEELNNNKDKSRIKDHFLMQNKIKSESVEKNSNDDDDNLSKLSSKMKSNDFMTKCENIFKAATGKLSISQMNSPAVAPITNNNCATVVVVEKSDRKIAINSDSKDNIQHQDWLEAGIRYSSTKITLPGDDIMADVANEDQHSDQDERKTQCHLDFSSICQRIAMSSLQGLPPLPRSLSGFNLNETRGEPPPPPARSSSKISKGTKNIQPSTSRPSPSGRQLTTLDTQLAILRKEMFGLRQLDLSLLSQLWSLNESIQEFRQLLQDQEDRAPSPSPSSEEGDDVAYGNHPPAPPRRPSSLHHHHHHHHHHHRPPRPPRPLRPLPSDESPSSEEYGGG